MFEHIRTRIPRRAWPASVTVLTLFVAACDESTVAPQVEEEILPGAITVTTETSGFMKDEGYELMVDGQSAGTIGANDAITIAELDPATYEVALGDVAENCAVESVSIDVAAAETAAASLSVVCDAPAPQAYTLRFGRARPNLDDGSITECPFSICSTNEAWDFYVYFSSSSDPHSVIRQNQNTGVEIAHLAGVTLETLTEEDVIGATFTAELVADPFDAGRVILIRTDQGNTYALGNPVEDQTAQTLSFDAALISEATGS